MIRIVPTGDLGLDVLLGGGWRLVKRLPDLESATVVVRGGSGAGKTLMGIQVALELARALAGNVVVACVEILPTEYVAQLQSARPSLDASLVSILPTKLGDADEPRVYVGLLLDLDPLEPDLVASLEGLALHVAGVGGKPVVFLVDSLIEGYGLGPSAPREAVDAVMKLAAERGCGLVLCEETATDATSPWVFTADTVLQLGVESRERGRWIEVRKHRFGPSASGRHELDISGREHPEAFPAPHSWITPGVRQILVAQGWRFETTSKTYNLTSQPPFDVITKKEPLVGEFTFISSQSEQAARAFATSLFRQELGSRPALVIELDPLALEGNGWRNGTMDVRYLPTSQGPARALRTLVEWFGEHTLADGPPAIGRVVLGDLGLVLAQPDAAEWVAAISAFVTVAIATNWGIPIAAYDWSTAGNNDARTKMASLADISVDITVPANQDVDLAINQRWPPRGLPRYVITGKPLRSGRVDLDAGPRSRGPGVDQ